MVSVDETDPAPPGMVLNHVNHVNNEINYQPQLVNAGFLNHQQLEFGAVLLWMV